MKLFEFDDYRDFFTEKCQLLPKKGRGQLRKMAQFMGVHTTTMSQIFGGSKSMTLEMAVSFAKFWKLSPLETKYLIALIQKERAGNHELKKVFSLQIKEMKEQGLERVNRMQKIYELDETQRGIFYSNWYFSAIRLLTSIKGFQSTDAIAAHLNLSPELVGDVLEFLIETGLCEQTQDGNVQMGPTHTHLESRSTLARSNHINWRLKAAENYERLNPADFVFTAPFTVAKKDLKKIRAVLANALDQITEIVEASDPEVLCCLNIDSVEVVKD